MVSINSAFRVLEKVGSKIIVSGSFGCLAKDDSGVYGHDGYFSDCAIAGGKYFGIKIIPGNPAKGELYCFSDDLSSGSAFPSESIYSGRIAAHGNLLYWQLGNVVKKYEVNGDSVLPKGQNDIGVVGSDIVVNDKGYYVLASNKVLHFSHSHQKVSERVVGQFRKLECSDKYVGLIGSRVQFDSQGTFLELMILDAVDLSEVNVIKQYGKFAGAISFKDDYLVASRPEYKQGSISGYFEVYNMSGDKVSEMQALHQAHSFSVDSLGKIYCATNAGFIEVDGSQLFPAQAQPDVDPFELFILNYGQDLSPMELNFLGLVQSFGFVKDVNGYVMFLNLLRG